MRRLPRLRFSTFPVLRSVIAAWPTLRQQPSNGSHHLDRAGNPVGFGFTWIADVINPTFMAAVDSPEPGGPTIKELVDPLTPLVRHPRALGLELTIYDPGLDPDRSCAIRLVSLLENVLIGVRSLDGRAA